MKFSVVTFGCRVNQADSLSIGRALLAAGGVWSPASAADMVVVNTCSVTAAAEQDARQAIRRLARLCPQARVIVTGCYARRDPSALLAIDGVHRIAGAAHPDLAPWDVLAASEVPVPSEVFAPTPLSPADFRPGFLDRTVAAVSVQKGCDAACSFCVVPETRGPSRSAPVSAVLEELRALETAGFNEVIIAGVHLGSWGRDFTPARTFADLLLALASEPGRLLLRLSSIEPMDFTPEIEGLVAGSARFAPHLHLPVQHASDKVLRRMRRPYAFDAVRRLFDRLRLRMPHAALGTDLLVGFPGEEESDFRVLENWLRASPLSYAHVFPFSPRPGTRAASMKPRVSGELVRERLAAIRGESARLQRRFSESQVGRVLEALTIGDGTIALTGNYLKVRIPAGRIRNERIIVRVVSPDPLRGETIG